MGAGKQRQPDGVGVLLDHGAHHLIRGLVQSGIDHLEARIPERSGDDLCAAVVPVQAGLGHDHSVWSFHRAPIHFKR